MKRRQRQRAQKILLTVCIAMVLIVAGLVYYIYRPRVVKAVTVEAGYTEEVDVQDFLINKKGKASILTDINALNLNITGKYEIKIKIQNRVHTSLLEVVDTKGPVAKANKTMVLLGDEVDPAALVTDVIDVSEYSVDYKEKPKFSAPGEHNVTVVLEDIHGNRSEVTSTVTVLDVKSTVQIEAGSLMNITTYDFVNSSKYTVEFITDLTKLDISKPTKHEIKMKVDGKEVISHIEVVDTTPPVGETSPRDTWQNQEIEAVTFISSISDVSAVKITYKDIPDYTRLGDQEVTLILEDEYGNTSEASAILTVKQDTEPPVIVGVKSQTVYEGEAVSYKKGVSVTDNKDSEVSFIVDSSGVNLTKAGTYEAYYSATDSSGNKTVETATITVVKLSVSKEEVSALARSVLDDILTDDMTQREQAWEIFQWIKSHVGYTGTSDKSDWLKEAYRGFMEGVGDCFTFYAVAEAMLTEAGIDNMRVTRVGGRTQHFWNLVNVGDGWYHFDTCPHKDKLMSFMLTDAEVEAYTQKRGNNYYTFDKSLYPATPLE